MFWSIPSISASSPVESVLDKENFTLEELLDEEDVIQECKALNSRLINFLRERVQVEKLLRYVVDEPQENADSKHSFKFPFIACEIFTCEIDVILKALVEEEELMDLLFSFLEPNHPHSALLAGYFSKVVICLMLRKTIPLMKYVQAHQNVFQQLVDLIGITSIMEVLIRLVGSDEHIYPNSIDVIQWLTDSNLLEMIVDKLSPFNPPEVHANAAETLCSITRNAPSLLASKLSSPSFVARIFGHALEVSHSKSGLFHSLSVCISLLDPKRSIPAPLTHSFRSQHVYDSPMHVNPDTVEAMLPKLGDLLMVLTLSLDEKVLPTTYGELRPPLGKHRLKIVEFVAVLLKNGNETAARELVSSGTIQRVLDLFFGYPYNNSLHHHVENIVYSCLQSKNKTIIDHLFEECGLLTKILQTEKCPILFGELNQPTLAAAGRTAPRVGNVGHLTRISNKLIQMGSSDDLILKHLQGSSQWNDWVATVLQERNTVENVYGWACGRPTALQDRNRDSDEDDIHERDYDVTALANNLSQAFRYSIYENEEAEEGHGSLDRDDEDAFFNDESAEVIISSLRLGDDKGSLFTNSNWFTFQDDKVDGASVTASPSETMDEINLNGSSSNGGGNSSSDDEVVVGEDYEDDLARPKTPNTTPPLAAHSSPFDQVTETSTTTSDRDLSFNNDKIGVSGDNNGFFDSDDPFGDRPIPEWVAWGDPSDFRVNGSGLNPFVDYSSGPNLENTGLTCLGSGKESLPNGTSTSSDGLGPEKRANNMMPSLFEEDVEFVGVELEGTEQAMEQALKEEGIVGEAGPLKRKVVVSDEARSADNTKEFNDANYWRVDQEVAVLE